MLLIACCEVFVQSTCAGGRTDMHAEKRLSFVFVAEKAAGCFAFTNHWVPLGSAHITVLMEQFLQ